MSKGIVYLVTIVVCALLQVGIAPAIQIGGAVPNFLIIPVVVIAMKSGYAAGSAAGFFCGLFEDLAGSGAIGCMALTFTIVAVIVGIVASTIDVTSPLVACVVVLCACLLCEFGYAVSVVLSNAESTGVIATIGYHTLPSTLYSAVFGCFAVVTINLVTADDSNASGMGRLGGIGMGGSPGKMPRMKSRLK